MTNNIFKTGAGLLALFGAMTLASCSDNDEMPAANNADGGSITLSLKGMKAPALGGEALSIFQFGKDSLISKTDIKNINEESIKLVKGSTTGLYCVSGITLETDNKSKSDFALSIVKSEADENSAPMFLSAYTPIEPTQMNCELTMTRGVARIDIDATDADMDITSVTVEDAPASSYVFTGAGILSDSTVVYTYTYDTPPTSLDKNVFLLFESDSDVHINVHGTVEGVEITVPAVLPAVERNKVYTLRVYDKNATVKAYFSVTDWEEGDNVVSGPDTSRGLTIDEQASEFPEGVVVDYINNIIAVPGDGVSGMKIAFNSEVRVDIDTVCYAGERVFVDSVEAKYVKIVPEKAYNTDNGVITKFNVDIDPQLKGRPDYEIKMYVKKTFMATSYDCVKIRVAPSRFQISTVKLAGVEWMAFNATTPDPNDQVYVEDGKTVEDMYVDDWVGCVGGLFQYGRQYKYIPYQSYNPVNDLGNQKQDMPWIHETHMPCPEGYHVATLEEWHALFPVGTQLTGTYVAGNGETITAEIVRLPGDVVTPTNVNGVCRYLKLTSAETGNCLILPLGGYKGDKSTAMSSNFGRDMVYWSNNCSNCNGGHARALRFMFNWGEQCVAEEFQWPMEAFAYVRAVKN